MTQLLISLIIPIQPLQNQLSFRAHYSGCLSFKTATRARCADQPGATRRIPTRIDLQQVFVVSASDDKAQGR